MADEPFWGWTEASLDRLYGFAYALAQDRDRSRDLVQECVLRALGAARRPRDEPAYRAWLFRILRNVFIDQCRKLRLEAPFEPSEEFVNDADAGWHGDRRIIDIVTVRLALAKLSVAHREVLVLVDCVGFSYAEAAEVLGVAEGTVMSRVSRARKALLVIMERENVTSLARARGSRR